MISATRLTFYPFMHCLLFQISTRIQLVLKVGHLYRVCIVTSYVQCFFTPQDWNSKFQLVTVKKARGLIYMYNPYNSLHQEAGEMWLCTQCQRVLHLLLFCLRQDEFVSCTLSHTAPDEIKATDNLDTPSKIFSFVCFFIYYFRLPMLGKLAKYI